MSESIKVELITRQELALLLGVESKPEALIEGICLEGEDLVNYMSGKPYNFKIEYSEVYVTDEGYRYLL